MTFPGRRIIVRVWRLVMHCCRLDATRGKGKVLATIGNENPIFITCRVELNSGMSAAVPPA
jgi:hypothetical protein